jgi:hypothetical protein
MYRSSFRSLDVDGTDVDDSESIPEEPNSDFPVQVRKPRTRNKTPADRLHLAVWNEDLDVIQDLVISKGSFFLSFYLC